MYTEQINPSIRVESALDPTKLDSVILIIENVGAHLPLGPNWSKAFIGSGVELSDNNYLQQIFFFLQVLCLLFQLSRNSNELRIPHF